MERRASTARPCRRLWLAAAVIALGCTCNAPHQRGHSPVIAGDVAAVPVYAIEFDDQGAMWDPPQLAKTLDAIRAFGNRHIIVITFIHGWKHNAESMATSYAFPIGQAPISWTKSFARHGGDIPGEKELFRHTAGHTSFLQSHALVETAEDSAPLAFKAGDGKYYAVTRLDGAWNQSSYWILRAPPSVIDGHNGSSRTRSPTFWSASSTRGPPAYERSAAHGGAGESGHRRAASRGRRSHVGSSLESIAADLTVPEPAAAAASPRPFCRCPADPPPDPRSPPATAPPALRASVAGDLRPSRPCPAPQASLHAPPSTP